LKYPADFKLKYKKLWIVSSTLRMNLVILFTVLLELVNTLEAQNFKCPQDKPGGACGKGKDSKGNFRKGKKDKYIKRRRHQRNLT
jgi:hypothetical protein